VLVTNLRENCHEPFRERLMSELPAAKLAEIHLHKDHNFGFLAFTDLEVCPSTVLCLFCCEF
jgi:hypothetical protein